VRRDRVYFLSEAIAGRLSCGWGLENPFFIGCLIIRSFLLRRHAGGNAEFLGDEKTPRRIGSVASALRQLEDRRTRHDAGGDDNGDVLFSSPSDPDFGQRQRAENWSTQDSLLVTLMWGGQPTSSGIRFGGAVRRSVVGPDRTAKARVLIDHRAIPGNGVSMLVSDAVPGGRRTSFGKMLFVEKYGIFIRFGSRYSGTMLGALGRGGAPKRPHHCFLLAPPAFAIAAGLFGTFTAPVARDWADTTIPAAGHRPATG